MKQNSHGFGHVGLLVGIIAVLVIGLVGWRLLDARQGKGVKKTSTDSATSQTSEKLEAHSQEVAKASELEGEKLEFKTDHGSFSVTVPKDWNYRRCGDHDGLVLLDLGGDGLLTCKQSDAKYPEDGWHVFGKVVIAEGMNGYARPDGSTETSVTLANNLTAQRYVYSFFDKESNETIAVTEYIVTDKDKMTVTAKAFSSPKIDARHPNALDKKAIVNQLEKILATLKLTSN